MWLRNLLVAMIHTSRGKSLHMWEQHTDVEGIIRALIVNLKIKKAPLEAEAPRGATSRISRILTSILYCELQLLHQRMSNFTDDLVIFVTYTDLG